ncbi:MAG TPA: hypothetical protein VEY95_04430 [Azospirillaceae bacterium]|nr:hypothetical protein [Azospirillaceae bacterium]
MPTSSLVEPVSTQALVFASVLLAAILWVLPRLLQDPDDTDFRATIADGNDEALHIALSATLCL